MTAWRSHASNFVNNYSVMLRVGRPDAILLGLRSGPAQQATDLLPYFPISVTENFLTPPATVFTATSAPLPPRHGVHS